MKKELLVSAILSASASSQLSATEIQAVRNEAEKNRPQDTALVYLSDAVYTVEKYDFQIRLTLRPAVEDSYKYVGREFPFGASLDLEMDVEYVNVSTGEVRSDHTPRFVKNLGKGKLKGFLCDSSYDCTENLNSFKAFTCDSTEACRDVVDYDSVNFDLHADMLIIEDAYGLDLASFLKKDVKGSLAFSKVQD